MAVEEYAIPISLEAGFDASGSPSAGQNRFVVVGTDGKLELCGANGRAIGVLTDKPEENKVGRVVIYGIVPIKVGSGGLTMGDFVQSAASGLAVTQSSTNPRLGVALETRAENEVASVLLKSFG